MAALLTTDSPTYLRRLTREINQAAPTRGAYTDGGRVLRARFTGRIVVTMLESHGTRDHDATHHTFVDGNGQEICASRDARTRTTP